MMVVDVVAVDGVVAVDLLSPPPSVPSSHEVRSCEEEESGVYEDIMACLLNIVACIKEERENSA